VVICCAPQLMRCIHPQQENRRLQNAHADPPAVIPTYLMSAKPSNFDQWRMSVSLLAPHPCVQKLLQEGGKSRAHSAEFTSWIPSWCKRDTFLVQVLHADHLQLSTLVSSNCKCPFVACSVQKSMKACQAAEVSMH
jgi:hypothetical protein